jgi:hypothetical protein
MTTKTTPTAATMAERIAAMRTEVLGDEHARALRVAAEAMTMAMSLPSALANTQPDPSSGVLTPEWVEAEVDRIAANERRTVKYNVLLGVAHDARGQADGIRVERTDAMLRGLAGLLAEIVAEVREIGDHLGEAADIRSAVASGHGDRWQRLTELAADYAELRTEQEKITPDAEVMVARPAAGWGDTVSSDLVARDLDNHWPYWRAPETDPRVRVTFTGEEFRPAPWPRDDDPEGQLLWLARQAQPWVPTMRELAELRRERQSRANRNAKATRTIRPHGDRFTERDNH